MENRLYKSRTNKYIGGICGGLGDYLSIDPTILRLIMVLLGFATSGIFVIVYIALCFIIPYPDEDRTGSGAYQSINRTAEKSKIDNSKQRKYLGYILIILGSLLFLKKLLPISISRFIIPLAALVIGLVLVISSLASDSGRKESTPSEIMPEHEPEYPDEDMTMKEDEEPAKDIINEMSEMNPDEEVPSEFESEKTETGFDAPDEDNEVFFRDEEETESEAITQTETVSDSEETETADITFEEEKVSDTGDTLTEEQDEETESEFIEIEDTDFSEGGEE